jgi:hypothetical protein
MISGVLWFFYIFLSVTRFKRERYQKVSEKSVTVVKSFA